VQAEIKAESKKPETKRKFDVIIIGAVQQGILHQFTHHGQNATR